MDPNAPATQTRPGAEAAAAAGAPRLAPSPEAPYEFGNYWLLEEIGRGGMGAVYKARQKGLDRLVAVKIILAETWAPEDVIRRFHLEARAAAALSHPNIVKVFDTGEVLGRHFIAMEYVAGRSLAETLSGGRPRIRDAARLVRLVAAALDHLHRQGIVHRDLKPSNILLDASGNPYVTDFGLAKVFGQDSRTRTAFVAGTPWYMSPEQAAGKFAALDGRSDIYSLGAILYELLTGRPPCVAGSPIDALVEVIEREPLQPRALNARVPRDLERVCLKCLAKSRDDRYADAAALGDDLDRFIAGEPVTASPGRLGRRFARWMRREPPLGLRLVGIGLFYLVELANYHVFRTLPWRFHVRATIVLLAWALASVGLQRMVKRPRWETAAIFAWGLVDVAAVTRILFFAAGVASPLVVAYPLLVAGSGLWLRRAFVWFVTALASLSYLALVADFYVWRPALHAGFDRAPDRHVFFVLMLLLIGGVVAYYVGRARALSRYYASRRRPWADTPNRSGPGA